MSPTHLAEAGAVFGLAAGDERGDAALAGKPAVLVVVVAAVGEQLPRAAAGTAAPAPDRRDGIDQRDQLGDVVAVAAGQRPGQRCPVRVGQKVVL